MFIDARNFVLIQLAVGKGWQNKKKVFGDIISYIHRCKVTSSSLISRIVFVEIVYFFKLYIDVSGFRMSLHELLLDN